MKKRILLIEDNRVHAEKTKSIIDKLNIFETEEKHFLYMPQNGDNPDIQQNRIEEFIREKLRAETSFDILMIDMLLGGDSPENPLGLKIIRSMKEELAAKTIVVYTEMASSQLDIIKKYNQEENVNLRIIIKPGNFYVTQSIVDCDDEKNIRLIKAHRSSCACDFVRCNFEDKLKCDMECLYYSLKEGE